MKNTDKKTTVTGPQKSTQMTQPSNQTHMTQPQGNTPDMTAPKPQGKTQMGKPAAGPSRVRVRALRDFNYRESDGKKVRVKAGEEKDIPVSIMEEVTKAKQGQYNFGGERSKGDATRHVIRKAELIA